MQFSAPIFILKQRAKALSRQQRIPLHAALDRVANQEGFASWSLLAARWNASETGTALSSQFGPGELVLIAARPGQGKTLLSLGLAVEWMARGERVAFFTLDLTRADVIRSFEAIDAEFAGFGDRLVIDDSDHINADYIVARLDAAPPNTLVVVDYLQLLDQKRDDPDVMQQVRRLKRFARERRATVVFLSQIHRRYDPSVAPFPALTDVRLPNPLDLDLFDKACFLNAGKIQFGTVTAHA